MRFLTIDNAWSMLINGHLFLIRRKGCFSHVNLSFIVLLKLLVLGNCLNINDTSGATFSNKADAPPIATNFTLPSPLPTWPSGGDFGKGELDLGGLQVRQVTTFQKIWAANAGGPDNIGATFFEASPIPDGFSMLGSYGQPNNRPLSGWVLVASDKSGDILKRPINYTLAWSGNDSNNPVFLWLPTPAEGYKPVGLVVTTTPGTPSLDRIRCVRSDFTADVETDNWILDRLYGMRPKIRGSNAAPVSVGSFVVQNDAVPLSCLLNKKAESTGKLNQQQMMAVFQTYAPYIYLHPEEEYLLSSVEWFFSNGALLYTKGQESNPVRIQPNGTNLPQGGSENGTYWLDLPTDGKAKEMVKKGDLATAVPYIHFKPVLGGTFTDIQIWLFYAFNGHATAKIGFIKRISLGKIGEHVGDWEHVTLRISNFDGFLYRVYFSQHSSGVWVDSCLLQYQSGNKFVGYSSKNGHAGNYKEGLYLQGPGNGVGIRNDWAKSDKVMDTGARFLVVSTEAEAEKVAEPAWLNYNSKWGPTKDYDTKEEVKKVRKFLIGKLKKALDSLVKIIDEVFGTDGPTGPKTKSNWNGDEQ